MPVRTLIAIAAIALLWGCTVPHGVYHTVREGETLYRISRTYGVDPRYLARINRIEDPTRLRVGERLFIPGGRKGRRVSPLASRSAPHERRAIAASHPVASSQPVATGSPRPAPSTSVAPTAENAVKFIWPVKGKILRRFGAKGSSYRKGIEIAAPAGDPVVSAAAGKVIYSGDGISGYGNLIILKHDNSFYTVYGFNRKNLVKAGTFVSEGQKIALSGAPPDGGRPCLYFELRSGRNAVDPIFYLP